MIKKIFSVCIAAVILVISSISVSAATDGVTGKCLKIYSYTVGEQTLCVDMDSAHALKPETEYDVSFCYTLGSANTSTKWGFGVFNKDDDRLSSYTEWNPIDLKYIWDLTIQDDEAEPIFTDIVWLDDEVVKCTFNFTTPSYVTTFSVTNQVGVGDAMFDNVHVESIDGSHIYDIDFEKGSTLAENFVSAEAENELATRNSAAGGSSTDTTQSSAQSGNSVVIGGNTSSEATSGEAVTESKTDTTVSETESETESTVSETEKTESETEGESNGTEKAAQADYSLIEKTVNNFTVLMIILIAAVGVAVLGAVIVAILVIKKLR